LGKGKENEWLEGRGERRRRCKNRERISVQRSPAERERAAGPGIQKREIEEIERILNGINRPAPGGVRQGEGLRGMNEISLKSIISRGQRRFAPGHKNRPWSFVERNGQTPNKEASCRGKAR